LTPVQVCRIAQDARIQWSVDRNFFGHCVGSALVIAVASGVFNLWRNRRSDRVPGALVIAVAPGVFNLWRNRRSDRVPGALVIAVAPGVFNPVQQIQPL